MYSETLQNQTREYFKKITMAMMKQFGTDKFGDCELRPEGGYSIRVFNSDEVVTFKSMDELLEASWAID